MKKNFNAERAIQELAIREGKTVEYIRSQMKLAMLSGLCNPDPKVQENWKRIPCKGEVPTPEEIITFLAAHAKAGTDPFV